MAPLERLKILMQVQVGTAAGRRCGCILAASWGALTACRRVQGAQKTYTGVWQAGT